MSLEEFLKMSRTPSRRFAAWGGWSYQQVRAWARGDRLPSLIDALKIESLTKGEVPITSWGYVRKKRGNGR
jgi:hypothetical protein